MYGADSEGGKPMVAVKEQSWVKGYKDVEFYSLMPWQTWGRSSICKISEGER